LKLESVTLYEAVFEDKIIAMSFFIFSHFAYYHLSANTPISYKLNANYLLLHNAFLEAQKKNIKYFILGGGTTSDKNDTLLKFKKKFSKLLKPFYIGGIIFNKDKYLEYNNLWIQQSSRDIKYFLKYRLEIT
jgi:lipid II:glycine glycyltransferase (peptidoglycan interpeptide bridge formation enzyme)